MRKLTAAAILLLTMLSLNACLYLNVSAPLDDDVSVTELGQSVGRASTHSVLWLFAWGDASTKAAAADGKITTIRHLDAHYECYVFGAYCSRTTIAYGDSDES
jgi:hypothetical protein